MKPIRLLGLVFCLGLLVSDCLSQEIKTSAIEKRVITGAAGAEVVGDQILFSSSGDLKVVAGVLVTIDSPYKFTRVRARCDNKKIELNELTDGRLLFVEPGVYEIEIVCFDPEKGIDDSELSFEIKPLSPTPPAPGPEPPPSPPPAPGVFDNLAQRVAEQAKQLTPQDRGQWSSTMQEVVRKMKAYEIKSIEESRAIIKAKKLPGAALNQMLSADAAKRQLSFDQAVLYYTEIEKGVR
jgi:hypothetical protein